MCVIYNDYCNALLAALPQSTMAPLQRVMNAAARLVCNLRSRDHVTPAPIKLHWLLITARVQYKLSARALSCCRHRTRLPQEHATSCVRTCVSEGTPIGHEQRHGRAMLSSQVWRTCVQHCRPESVEQYSCRSVRHTEHCYIQKEPENIFIPWILFVVLT